MATHEAVINGYLLDRQRDRRAVGASNVGRARADGASDQNGCMGAQPAPADIGLNAVDAGSGRNDQHGRRVHVRRRSYSQSIDVWLTFACHAAWGGLIGCGVVFVVWTVAKVVS